MEQRLINLQREFYELSLAQNEYFPLYSPKFSFFKAGELYEMEFYGSGYDEEPYTPSSELDADTNVYFAKFTELISEPNVANRLLGLKFDGADTGANGSNEWDFSRLIASGMKFENLAYFHVAQTGLAEHNHRVISENSSLEERGQIARLLALMPALRSLVLPSAPDQSFFEREHGLVHLSVQMGYDKQDFVRNLAQSSNLSRLKTLELSDILTQVEQEQERIGFEELAMLFGSRAFQSVRRFVLRGANLSHEQLKELQKMARVQFLFVEQKSGKYVAHI